MLCNPSVVPVAGLHLVTKSSIFCLVWNPDSPAKEPRSSCYTVTRIGDKFFYFFFFCTASHFFLLLYQQSRPYPVILQCHFPISTLSPSLITYVITKASHSHVTFGISSPRIRPKGRNYDALDCLLIFRQRRSQNHINSKYRATDIA